MTMAFFFSAGTVPPVPPGAMLPPLPVFPLGTVPSAAPGLPPTSSAALVHLPSVPATVLSAPGPYNPAASLPPKVVKKVLGLEFVEMAELKADVWVDEPSTADANPDHRASKPLGTDIRIWLECYGRMAALLLTRFPEKVPELWAYQSTVLRAAHYYEGANWVAYDR